MVSKMCPKCCTSDQSKTSHVELHSAHLKFFMVRDYRTINVLLTQLPDVPCGPKYVLT